MNEHGYCPSCNADLDGGGIWEHFYQTTGSYFEATRIAAHYGATKTQGKWGRAIGIYDTEKDMTVSYRCPDCNHTWSRT